MNHQGLSENNNCNIWHNNTHNSWRIIAILQSYYKQQCIHILLLKFKIFWIQISLNTLSYYLFIFQCLVVGWYISCLLQFIVIGTILISVCVKYRKIGVGVTVICLCISLAIPFISTYVTRSYGIIRVVIPWVLQIMKSYKYVLKRPQQFRKIIIVQSHSYIQTWKSVVNE